MRINRVYRLLVVGLHHALRTKHLETLVVSVAAVSRQIDHADGARREVHYHRDRVEIIDLLDIRNIRVSENRDLQSQFYYVTLSRGTINARKSINVSNLATSLSSIIVFNISIFYQEVERKCYENFYVTKIEENNYIKKNYIKCIN